MENGAELKPEIDRQIKDIAKIIVEKDIEVVITLKSDGQIMWSIPTDLKVACYLVRILNCALDDLVKGMLKPKESRFIKPLLHVLGRG